MHFLCARSQLNRQFGSLLSNFKATVTLSIPTRIIPNRKSVSTLNYSQILGTHIVWKKLTAASQNKASIANPLPTTDSSPIPAPVTSQYITFNPIVVQDPSPDLVFSVNDTRWVAGAPFSMTPVQYITVGPIDYNRSTGIKPFNHSVNTLHKLLNDKSNFIKLFNDNILKWTTKSGCMSLGANIIIIPESNGNLNNILTRYIHIIVWYTTVHINFLRNKKSQA